MEKIVFLLFDVCVCVGLKIHMNAWDAKSISTSLSHKLVSSTTNWTRKNGFYVIIYRTQNPVIISVWHWIEKMIRAKFKTRIVTTERRIIMQECIFSNVPERDITVTNAHAHTKCCWMKFNVAVCRPKSSERPSARPYKIIFHIVCMQCEQ